MSRILQVIEDIGSPVSCFQKLYREIGLVCVRLVPEAFCARSLASAFCDLYSSVSWEITNFESPKTSTASAPASTSNSIPLHTASYSAKLLVQGAGNLIEKGYVTPRGDTSRMPTPHPSSQANPSKYIAHARTKSVAILVLILSAIRSANACPLTAFAG
jgi:hypothetical protein